jgi:VWFA-related protein
MVVALGATASTQNPTTFRGGVSLVHVDAEVVAKNGRVLTGFSKEDFRVFDEGREQPISAFSADEQPLDLILLFDISGSMRSKVKQVAAAAHQGLQQLRLGDRVSVMVFNRETRLIAPFSEDLAVVERAIERVLGLRFGGGTAIQEGVHDAANRFIWFDDLNGHRRAVLIVTDNVGKPTRRESSVVEDMWEADALLSGLVVSNRAANIGPFGLLAALGARRPGGIEHIVEQTGGDTISSDDLGSTFPEMMHRIRSRYSLYYRMPEGTLGSLRTIHLDLSAGAQQRFPEARVAARKGYRFGGRDENGFTKR